MESTTAGWVAAGEGRAAAVKSLADELAVLSAHLNAATARWLELALEFRRRGGAAGDDFACWLAFRCGVTVCEARELVRVAEALEELPVIRTAFARGELTLCKVRALTRVAGPGSEASLLELAKVMTASQLERALRAYRRISREQADAAHELEYVDYHWTDDGSLVLRARLAAEDGSVLVLALDAARERVWERRRAKRSKPDPVTSFEQPRSARVEALIELAHTAAGGGGHHDRAAPEQARLVVHVDAAALTTDGRGRCELETGPVIAAETARRLGCDSDQATVIERDGLPVSVGRARRTVPPALRRLLEARDHGCRWPGCDRQRHLAAHHKQHWAHGGDTSLDNLILLCTHHHRLVHEGGYTIETDNTETGGLRFRNRHGLLHPSPSRPPPGRPDALIHQNQQAGLRIDRLTNRHGLGDPMDLDYTIGALQQITGVPERVMIHP